MLQTPATLDEVKAKVHTILQEKFKIDTPLFILTPSALAKALENSPYRDETSPNKIFITFLSGIPDPQLQHALAAVDHGEEQYQLIEDILYFYLPEGMSTSKLSNTYFEKKLKVAATGRNLNTIKKMLELATQ